MPQTMGLVKPEEPVVGPHAHRRRSARCGTQDFARIGKALAALRLAAKVRERLARANALHCPAGSTNLLVTKGVADTNDHWLGLAYKAAVANHYRPLCRSLQVVRNSNNFSCRSAP